jgi:hypothetical protein
VNAERTDGNVAHLAQTRAPWLAWCRCFRPGAPSSDPVLQCFFPSECIMLFPRSWEEEIMSHPDPFSSWKAMVSSAFPHLSRPQATVLALWSYGMVLAKACGITLVSAALALQLGRKEASLVPRLRE